MVVLLVPFMFTGCESNKTASQVANQYSKLQEKYPEFFNSSTRKFDVTFNNSVINGGMNDPNSMLYCLGKLYIPTLRTSMTFVNSKAKSFKECLSKFSQEQINRVNAGLEELSSALKSFSNAKETYEQIATRSGNGLADFIKPLQKVINSAQDFNLAFYNGYYTNIYAKTRDYNKSGFTFTNDDKAVEVMGGKLYIATIINNHYIKHYVWKAEIGSVNSFIAGIEGNYFNLALDLMKNTNIGSYREGNRETLIALREGHNSFVKEMNRALSAMKKVPYKGIYGGKMVTNYSKSVQNYYTSVENFMATKFAPIYSVTQSLTA